MAHSRGLIGFDETVATYWPEFAQNNKEKITVRQLLSHQAGLCALDKPLTYADAADLDKRSEIIEAQRPLWTPGSRQGYHAVTLGWYESELIRRVDSKHRSIAMFLQDEVCRPLGLEFYIGLPPEVSDSRIAEIRAFGLPEISGGIYKMPLSTAMSFLNPLSMTSKAFSFPKPAGSSEQQKRRNFLSFEGPGINGIGQVRSIAKAYSALVTGGGELGFRKETIEALTVPSNSVSRVLRDEVLKINTSFSVGFVKPFSAFNFGSENAFGMNGTGGSIGFADPDFQVGFAYAPNNWHFRLFDDPRQKALLDALALCLKRIS
ncbi:MAG: beta-lactamase family protein [Candidatus Bathyarchaeota archaeon]|nr:beta-lactamase family protein [Candidatus Bathyarchaeota archaeon]